jgi:hypothetical protein
MKGCIEACPVTEGNGPCHGCGGGWPGTLASSRELTKAALKGILIPERLKCGPLAARASHALHEITLNHMVFDIPLPATEPTHPVDTG